MHKHKKNRFPEGQCFKFVFFGRQNVITIKGKFYSPSESRGRGQAVKKSWESAREKNACFERKIQLIAHLAAQSAEYIYFLFSKTKKNA